MIGVGLEDGTIRCFELNSDDLTKKFTKVHINS